MKFLADGARPEGPTDKLCPSEEPKEALAETGPDGRMVRTISWRTHTLMNRDARLPSNSNFRPSHT